MFVRINYSNGYCGCDVSEVLEVENIEEAEAYAYENCTFDIEEIAEKSVLEKYRKKALNATILKVAHHRF